MKSQVHVPVSLKTYVSACFQGRISGKPTSKSSKLRCLWRLQQIFVVVLSGMGLWALWFSSPSLVSACMEAARVLNLSGIWRVVASGIWRFMLLLNLKQRKSLLNLESGLVVKGTVY